MRIPGQRNIGIEMYVRVNHMFLEISLFMSFSSEYLNRCTQFQYDELAF
jgi:hypothetical protein